MHRARVIGYALVRVVAVALLLTQVALAMTALYLKHHDLQVLEVVGGSMGETYRVGDAVVIDKDVDDVGPGDVVTFHDQDRLTTHRVVATRVVDGDTYLQTKGDANRTPDPDLVAASAIVGRPVYHVRYGGRVNAFLTSPLGRGVTFAPVLLLIAFAELGHARRAATTDPDRSEHPDAPRHGAANEDENENADQDGVTPGVFSDARAASARHRGDSKTPRGARRGRPGGPSAASHCADG